MKAPRALALLFALLGFASCDAPGPQRAAEPAAAPIFDQLIVAGKRIGPVAIGMPVADLIGAIGEPNESLNMYCGADKTKTCLIQAFWNDRGLSVRFPTVTDSDYSSQPKERVDKISVTDSRWATAEGLKVGSSEVSVRAKLGTPLQQRREEIAPFLISEICYPGINFSSTQGKVTYILVQDHRYCRR